MNPSEKTCVIVADGARARLFLVAADDSPRRTRKLVEQSTLANRERESRGGRGADQTKSERNTNRQAGPVHPIGAARDRHRLEHERRFGGEIVESAVRITRDWDQGTIVLIAEPRLLGLMRKRLRAAVNRNVGVEELAKDYSGVSDAALERLVFSRGSAP